MLSTGGLKRGVLGHISYFPSDNAPSLHYKNHDKLQFCINLLYLDELRYMHHNNSRTAVKTAAPGTDIFSNPHVTVAMLPLNNSARKGVNNIFKN